MQYVTIQQKTVVDGMVFNVNDQYPWKETVSKKKACGCGYNKYYVVCCNDTDYHIFSAYSFLTENVIDPNFQGFQQKVQNAEEPTILNDPTHNYDNSRNRPDLGRIYESVNNIPM